MVTPENSLPRKLTAIMQADVVGYDSEFTGLP